MIIIVIIQLAKIQVLKKLLNTVGKSYMYQAQRVLTVALTDSPHKLKITIVMQVRIE